MTTLLVDSGASQNFEYCGSSKTFLTSKEGLCRGDKCKEATVCLSNGTIVRSERSHVEPAFSFSDFSCKEVFASLDMMSLNGLILSILRLVRHQRWIARRSSTVSSSRKDARNFLLLRITNLMLCPIQSRIR